MARAVSGAQEKNKAPKVALSRSLRSASLCSASLSALFSLMLLSVCSTPVPGISNPSPSGAVPSSVSPAPARDLISVSPAPARDLMLDALIARQERVYRIAAPLITKNAVLCRTSARPLLGFTAKNVYSFPADIASSVRKSLSLDDRLQVMQVLEGSGAMRAGLIRGDILQSIQDMPLPEGPQAETEAARLLAPVLKNLSEIRVNVQRRGQNLTVQVPLTLACAFAIDVGNSPNLNAYADGRRIMLTRGLLEALPADEDIAVLIARELAHNVLQHARQLQQTATLSSVIDSLLPMKPEIASYTGSSGIKPTPDKMDQDADRLGLFMLARAGYDPMNLARVSQRLAELAPTSQSNSYSALHPWTEERRTLALATVKEIRQKQAAKKPLVP